MWRGHTQATWVLVTASRASISIGGHCAKRTRAGKLAGRAVGNTSQSEPGPWRGIQDTLRALGAGLGNKAEAVTVSLQAEAHSLD